MYELTVFDLSIAAILVLLLAVLTTVFNLGVTRSLLISMLRMMVQLSLIGMVLKFVFDQVVWYWVFGIVLVMHIIAGYEIWSRQQYRVSLKVGLMQSTTSLFVSSFSIALITLLLIVHAQPWYDPQYAIPLVGMLLGNSMSSIALANNDVTKTAWRERARIESQLALGFEPSVIMQSYRRSAMKVGMIPIINAMAASGIISLPGMMTGQILAGASPVEAVKYQILIMLLIATVSGVGTMTSVRWTICNLFDERQRLRLDRLTEAD